MDIYLIIISIFDGIKTICDKHNEFFEIIKKYEQIENKHFMKSAI